MHTIVPTRSNPAALDLSDPGSLLAAKDREWLQVALSRALAHLGVPGELRVKIIADAEMAAAHAKYSNVEGTTDVLTFDLSGDPAHLDCDLLVCIDEATRQAQRRGHSAAHELLLYCLHGVLHCLGEDDHDDDAAARMHAREDTVLIAIGVGPVFAAPAKGGGK